MAVRTNITAQNPAAGATPSNAIKRNIPISGNPARQRAKIRGLSILLAWRAGATAFTGPAETGTGAGSTGDFASLATDGTGTADDDF